MPNREQLIERAEESGKSTTELEQLFDIDHDRTNNGGVAEIIDILLADGEDAEWIEEMLEDDEDEGDDLCDLCMSSGVNVDRTTYCGKTIGIECGCEETSDGTCGDPDCEACKNKENED